MEKEKVIQKITDVGIVAVVRAESAEQAKKIPRPVFLVNSICDADNTRGGCYAFLNGKTVCEVPMGQDGYLLVRV